MVAMKEGDLVTIHGLQAAADLNGKTGKILPGRKGERYVIALESGVVRAFDSPQCCSQLYSIY